MIYSRRKNLITICEIWYALQQSPEKKSDIVKYKFVPEKPEKAAFVEDLFTIEIDLKKEKEAIFSGIGKNTRYKINRAKERDAVTCGTFLELHEKNDEKLEKYMGYFNEFTATKNRSAITFSDLEQFYEAGALCIRYAASQDESLVYTMHAYIVSDGRARLHQSSSHFRSSDDSEFRNLIGRANRYLHWDDILYFKNLGLEYYDLGGWYGGRTDKEKIAINEFKESFGGEKRVEYTYIVPLSHLGKAAVFLQTILKARKKRGA
jgi:lipid II:glycine glycyltransferase (peptidoglycan interpeptide bridge formation enzyme)